MLVVLFRKRIESFLQAAKKAEVVVALLEGPRQAAWEKGERRCAWEQWRYGTIDFVTTEFGEGLARRRRALVAQLVGEEVDWKMTVIRAEAPSPASAMLQTPSWEDKSRWVRPHRMELLGGQPRDPMLPQGLGHYCLQNDKERMVLHGLGGPVRWPLFDDARGTLEDIFVYDRKGPPGHLRKLTPMEIWMLQGRDAAGPWSDKGFEKWIVEGTKATGARTASSLLTVGGYILYMVDRQRSKAGMGKDPQGAEAMAQILVWLRRWKRGELRRAGGLCEEAHRHITRWVESWWLEVVEGEMSEEEGVIFSDGHYAGGRRKKSADEVIGDKTVEAILRQPRPFDGQVANRVEEWLEENMGGDKAVSTERAYAGSWLKWKAWARRQGWPSEFLNLRAMLWRMRIRSCPSSATSDG